MKRFQARHPTRTAARADPNPETARPTGQPAAGRPPSRDASASANSARRIALRTAGAYALVGVAWIALSDRALTLLVTDRETAGVVAMLKGWIFVGVTSVLLYCVLDRQLRRWKDEAAARQRAAEALATSETQLANALKMAHAGHWEYDVATDRFTFNDYFYRVLRTTCAREGGYTMTAAHYAARFLPPEDARMVADEIRRTIAATDPHYTRELEHRVLFGDGTVGELAVRVFIVKDAAGRTVKIHGVNQDVTEQKHAGQALRESQALYRSLVDHIPAGVFRKDAAGRFVFVNERFCRVEGLGPEKFIGRTAQEVADELAQLNGAALHDWHQTIKQTYTGGDHHTLIMQSGQPIKTEEEWISSAGHRRYFQAVKTPVLDSDGTIVGSQGILFEITERKQAEAALRASEEHLQLASHVGGVGTFEHDRLTGETRASSVLKEIDGLGDGGNRFAALIERLPPEDRSNFLAAWQRADDPAGDGRIVHEHRLRQPDGSIRWLRLQAQTWFAGAGAAPRPVRTIGTVMDITERKRAEEALRTNEARYHSLFENMLNGFAYCEMLFEDGQPADFVYLAVNRAFTSLTGLKDVAGKRVSVVIPGIRQADPDLFALYGRVVQTGIAEKAEIYVAALHQWFDIAVYRPGQGQFVAVFDVITERKKAEAGLRTLSRAIEQSPVSIVITDPVGAIEYVNPRFTEVTGYVPADVLGKTSRVLKSGTTPPEVYRDLWTTILSGREWHGEFCNRKKSGGLFWEHAAISPVIDELGHITHFVAVKEDVTERRQLEEQLRRAQRLEAVGALSSGVAHDLNNIFAPILLAPSLLSETLRTDHERQLLDLIEQSAHRGSEIVKQLLTFSRGTGGARTPLQVRHLLKEMRAIVTETFPREIELLFDAPANLLEVLGEATQLHQVLLNLCVNARDAMPGGGTLALRAQNVMVGADQIRMRPAVKPGAFVVIAVADSGCGIPADILERIFDPFFTTKEPGKGTGLGLSTVLGIVRSHGGFVEVDSKPDQGSTFRIYLPAAPSELPVPPSAMNAEPARGRDELILIVDDEPAIRESSRIALERHGYRTLLATRGNEALGIFRVRAAEIALVLTDIMMPVMGGVALIRELRQIRPDVKVLVTTGMASDTKQAELTALGIATPLPKPCGRRELLEAVHRALAR